MNIYLVTVEGAVGSPMRDFFVLANDRADGMDKAYRHYAKLIEPEAYVQEINLVGETVNGATNWMLDVYMVGG